MNPHEDTEQIDRAREWWQKNGSAVIGGIVLGLAGVLGINFWQTHQTNQAQTASALFDQMSQAFSDKDMENAVLTGQDIVDNYASTPYAASASLYLAKIDVDKKDYASAKKHLQWVVDNAKSVSMVHTARIRLAYIALAENQPQQALTLLEGVDAGAFLPHYQELLGDAYSALDRSGEAVTAYEKALGGLAEGSPYVTILQQKINKASVATN